MVPASVACSAPSLSNYVGLCNQNSIKIHLKNRADLLLFPFWGILLLTNLSLCLIRFELLDFLWLALVYLCQSYRNRLFSCLTFLGVKRGRSEEEGSEGEGARAEEIVGDEDREVEEERYESEDDRYVEPKREKPVGPPLELQVPMRQPPALPEQACPWSTLNFILSIVDQKKIFPSCACL